MVRRIRSCTLLDLVFYFCCFSDDVTSILFFLCNAAASFTQGLVFVWIAQAIWCSFLWPTWYRESEFMSCFMQCHIICILLSSPVPGHLFINNILLKCSDFTGKSCCYRMLPEFSQCERARVDKHVHRRVREKYSGHFSEGKLFLLLQRCFKKGRCLFKILLENCRLDQLDHVSSSSMSLILLLLPGVLLETPAV